MSSDKCVPVNMQEIQKRKRMLFGDWSRDLLTYMSKKISSDLIGMIGTPTCEYNLFKTVTQSLAVIYDRGVKFTTSQETDSELVEIFIKDLFTQHKYLSTCVLGLIDSWLYLKVVSDDSLDPETGELVYAILPEILTPDQVKVYLDEFGRPCKFTKDIVSKGEPLTEVIEIEGGVGKWYTIKRDESLVEIYDYVWVDSEDRPFLPFIKYSIGQGPDFYNTNNNQDLVDGSLSIATSSCQLDMKSRDSSFAIRYLLDCNVVSSELPGQDDLPTSRIAISSNGILQLESAQDKSASVGVLQATVDIDKEYTALKTKIENIMQLAGIAGLQVTTSDESGIALIVKRQFINDKRREIEPAFKSSDKEYLKKYIDTYNYLSKITNKPSLLDSLVILSIEYPAIPLTLDEQQKELEYKEKQISFYRSLRDDGVIDQEEYNKIIKTFI